MLPMAMPKPSRTRVRRDHGWLRPSLIHCPWAQRLPCAGGRGDAQTWRGLWQQVKRVKPAEGHPQEGLPHGQQKSGLEPQYPGFWAPGAGFMEDNFSTHQGWGGDGFGIQVHYIHCAQ